MNTLLTSTGRTPFLSTFIGISLLFFSFISRAQTDSLRSFSLEEVVVTATRSEKQRFDIPRSVTVISRQEVQNGVYHHVGDLLAQEAGIFITGAGQTPGTLQNLYLRGANSNHNVVMIDGVRITDPSSTNNSIDLSELSLIDIERIEVVRGTHSTLFGSSAIGGVVNIITRQDRQPGFHGQAGLRGGIFGPDANLLGQDLSLRYLSKNGFYATADLRNTQVNGLDASLDTIRNPAPFQQPDRDDFSKTAFGGKIGFRNQQWQLFAGYKRVNQAADIDDGPFRDDDNYTLDFRRDLWLYGADFHPGKTVELSYRGGWTDLLRTSVDDSSRVDAQGNFDHSFSENAFDGGVWSNELQLTWQPRGLTLVAGAGRYDEQMSARSYFFNSAWNFEATTDLDSLNIRSHTTNAFVYLDLSGTLLDASLDLLGLTLGARWNRHSAFGDYFTYEVAPSLQLGPSTLLYGNMATGFNAPSLYQLFTPETNYLSGIRRGNPALLPERSMSFELGWKQRIGDRTSLQLALFQTRVTDVIEYVYLWDPTVPTDSLGSDWMRDDFRGDTYLNTGNQTNRGIELSIESQLSRRFSVTGNLSIVEGKLHYRPEEVSSDHTQGNRVQLFANGAFLNREVSTNGLPRRSNTANLRLTYRPNDRLSTALQMRHAGPRNDIIYDASLGPFGALNTTGVDGFTLVDLHANYHFSSRFTLFLRIENLLDTAYREVRGYRSRGRGAYLKVQLNW